MTAATNRIREFRQARGWTLQQLADAAGTTKSQIDKLEKGERRLTVDWLMRLAPHLDCDPRDILQIQAQHISASPPPAPLSSFNGSLLPMPSLPVRGVARGGTAQEIHWTDGPIDQVPRPHYLAHVKDAYAVYVVGDSMVPMYRPRQLLFINPYKPPVPGSGVVLTLKDGAALVKEYVRQKVAGVMLREYHPSQRDFTVSHTEIAALHAVVGATEPQ